MSTKKAARNTLISGGVIYALSVILNVITLGSLYGSVDKCSKQTVHCSYDAQQLITRISFALLYISMAIIVIGLVMLILAFNKKSDEL